MNRHKQHKITQRFGTDTPSVLTTQSVTVRCAVSKTGFHTVTASYNMNNELVHLGCDCDRAAPDKVEAARIMSAIAEDAVPMCSDLKRHMREFIGMATRLQGQDIHCYIPDLAEMHPHTVKPRPYYFHDMDEKDQTRITEARTYFFKNLVNIFGDRRSRPFGNDAFVDTFSGYLKNLEADRKRQANDLGSNGLVEDRQFETLATRKLEAVSGCARLGLGFRIKEGKLLLVGSPRRSWDKLDKETLGRATLATYRGLGCWDFSAEFEEHMNWEINHGAVMLSALASHPGADWHCPCCEQTTRRPKQHVNKSKKHRNKLKTAVLQTMSRASTHLCRHSE